MTRRIPSATHVFPLVAVVALAAIVVTFASSPVSAAPGGYRYEQVGAVPQSAPGIPGKFLVRDFEVNGLNMRGDVLFGADYHSTGFICQPGTPTSVKCPGAEGEGLWTTKNDVPTLIAKSGDLDPDSEQLSPAFLGPAALNNSGDVAVAWNLIPVPVGHSQASRLHAGLYRYNAAKGALSVIVKTGSPAPGGTFAGVGGVTAINGSGSVAFSGITENAYGTVVIPPSTVDPNFPQYAGKTFGAGIYLADNKNNVTAIAVPGDSSPRGGYFKAPRNQSINDAGDVAFGGRTNLDPGTCVTFGCNETAVYVRWAETGVLQALVGVGDPAPVPPLGTKYFRDYTWGPRVNNQGQVLFSGGIDDPYTPPPSPTSPPPSTRGLFLWDDGDVSAIAYPGQALTTADGDTFNIWRVTFVLSNYASINDGAVAFGAQYWADANLDNVKDSAVFVWKNGEYKLVAKTGDSLPGIGVIREIADPARIAGNSASRPVGGVQLNSRGQVAFHATLEPVAPNPGPLGIGVLLVATPSN